MVQSLFIIETLKIYQMVKNDLSPETVTSKFLQQAQTQDNLRDYMTLEILQYDLCIENPKFFHLLELKHAILRFSLETIRIS